MKNLIKFRNSNNQIIFLLLIFIWLSNLISINTGFYSVKNFYYNFEFNTQTLINFINTLRWIAPIITLPILIKLLKNDLKIDSFSKIIIFWTIFQIIYIFFLDRDKKILEINSPQIIDNFNLLINYLVTIFLFIYIRREYNENLNLFFLILIFFICCVSVYFFFNIILSAIENQKLFFYHNHALNPGKLYFDQPVPRITGLSRMLVVIFIVIFFIKDFKVKSNKTRLFLNIILFFIVIFIFLSQTRGSVVGIGIFYLFYLTFVKTKFKKKIFTLFLFLLLPFIITHLLSKIDSQKNSRSSSRISETLIFLNESLINKPSFNNDIITNNNDDDITINKGLVKKDAYAFSSGRMDIWKTSINLILENKKILGYGPQGDRYALSIIAKNFNEAAWQNNASNSLIYSIISTGLVGLVCLLLLYFFILKCLIKTLFNIYYNHTHDYLILSCTTLVMFILLRSIFENSFVVFGIDYCLLIPSYFILQSNLEKTKIE